MTDPASCVRSAIDTNDGERILIDTWAPTTDARGIVQILHGLSEHAARYERFAWDCVEQGFVVVVHDHRGHGATCPADELGHFADEQGWQKVIDDAVRVSAAARQSHAGLPFVLFGHSMGSYIAQAFVIQQPNAVDALVLSGSTAAPRLQLYLGRLAARFEAWRRGKQFPSPTLNQQAFGAFNKRFAPTRTEFDWLSRDEAEVDLYVADPLCGAVPSAQLWYDLLGGLVAIGKKSSLRKVPSTLPVLITGGSEDPVGGRHGMQKLATLWAATGHVAVTLQVFDDGRHEMLNETNREDFTDFVLKWMSAAIDQA